MGSEVIYDYETPGTKRAAPSATKKQKVSVKESVSQATASKVGTTKNSDTPSFFDSLFGNPKSKPTAIKSATSSSATAAKVKQTVTSKPAIKTPTTTSVKTVTETPIKAKPMKTVTTKIKKQPIAFPKVEKPKSNFFAKEGKDTSKATTSTVTMQKATTTTSATAVKLSQVPK